MRAASLAGLAAVVVAAACAPADPAASWVGPGLAPEVRPDTPGNNLQFAFDSGDLVETFGSADGHFLVHYTRTGPNGVPALDADVSGVPDFVEEVAAVYVEVLAHYQGTLGFRAPLDDSAIGDNGGDERFDVYLVDFAGVGDGNYRDDACLPQNSEQCAGYMVEENDFSGYGYPSTLYANRILGSHEFFHAVQSAYDNGQGSVLAEGTAVWATESYRPALDDFEWFLDGYLDNPDRPLDTPLPGPVDPFSYGSAIFFQFLEEHYGPGTVRALWEACENGAGGVADPQWLEVLGPTLATQASSSFAEAMVEFARWNLYTGVFGDPAASYQNGGSYPRVRIDDVPTPHQDDALRVYHASSQYYAALPGGRAQMTAALVAPASDPGATDGVALLLATERGGNITSVVDVADVGAGEELVDTAVAERLVVVAVNTATGGDSKRPGLCIGSPEEVADCRAALSGAGGSGGAPAAPVTDESEGGCGCRMDGDRAPTAPASLAALGVLALAAVRRRRRAG